MGSDPWSGAVDVVRRMGSPMRPHPSEARAMADWLLELATPDGPLEVLVLGVTPELVAGPWPERVRLVALDRSSGMIRAFWPGAIPGRRRLVFGDWDATPLRAGAFDFVVGDGVLNTRTFPRGYLELGARVRELLRPDGCFLVRAFVRPDDPEPPEYVLACYRAGRLDDYDALRFRFLMSLQENTPAGVWGSKELIDRELEARGVSLEELYRRTGYEPPPAARARAAAGSEAGQRVSYPTLGELEGVMARGFRILGRRHGSHPLARRCPIFALRRV
jgi:SAM-dependent methyltransferase